jgi:hypothetical protein
MTDQPGTYDGALDGPDVIDADVIDPGTGLAVPEGRDVAVPEYGIDPWSEPEIVAEAYDLPPAPSSRGTSAPGRQVTGDAPAAASGGGSRGGGRGGGGSGGRPRKGRSSRAGGRGGITLLGLHLHLPSISLLSGNSLIKVGRGSAKASGTRTGRSSGKTSGSRRSGTSRRTSGLRVPQRRPIHRRGLLDRMLGGGR